MPRIDLRVVASAPTTSIQAVGYRNQPPGFDPLSGVGARRAGGRFNPPNSFPVLYLCTTRPCAAAELTRQAKRQGLRVDDFLPREVFEITGTLDKVLDLTDHATLDALGIAPQDLVREDRSLTREIGEAAYEHGFQAIRSPSATGVDDVLAIFPENLAGAVLDYSTIEEWAAGGDLPTPDDR